MKIHSLYNRGETLSWRDRLSLACMRNLGVPDDYLDFVSHHGDGEFAFSLRVESPETLLSELARGEKDKFQIADLDDGTVFAVRKGDAFEFVMEPSSIDHEAKIFATWESVLKWAMGEADPAFPLPVYEQRTLPMYTMQDAQGQHDINVAVDSIKRLLNPNGLVALAWNSLTYVMSQADGMLVVFQDNVDIRIRYRLLSNATQLVAILANLGWSHEPHEAEDELLTWVGKPARNLKSVGK